MFPLQVGNFDTSRFLYKSADFDAGPDVSNTEIAGPT